MIAIIIQESATRPHHWVGLAVLVAFVVVCAVVNLLATIWDKRVREER